MYAMSMPRLFCRCARHSALINFRDAPNHAAREARQTVEAVISIGDGIPVSFMAK